MSRRDVCAEGMSLQGSWSDDGRSGRHARASAEYLHRQDTTGSTNSPEAPLTRQRGLWPEPTLGLPGPQPGSAHATPELTFPHGKRLQQPASVETTASAQTVIADAAADCSIGRQVLLLVLIAFQIRLDHITSLPATPG